MITLSVRYMQDANDGELYGESAGATLQGAAPGGVGEASYEDIDGQYHRPHPLRLPSTTQTMWRTFIFTCSTGTGCT